MKKSVLAVFLAFCLCLPFPARAFRVRGMHIDMRAEVMTLSALKDLVDEAAGNGLNTLIMEYGASFPFDENAVLRSPEAYTADEIRAFTAYAAARGIDIIPLQNCFGHCEYILRHERYRSLREDALNISQVCPSRPEEARDVFRSIFAEVAALHPSPYLHIGCDETRLLGHCPACAKRMEEVGKSRLFVDYVKLMCEVAGSLGKVPVIWGDIILRYPDALEELPRNLVIMNWNYGWKADYFGDTRRLVEAGFTIWGAPSLRCAPDNIYLTEWYRHFLNLENFVPYAREQGYDGIIETSWSTAGVYTSYVDALNEVLDIHTFQIRWPLPAFRILVEAFGASCRGPIDPDAFIRRYAVTHFGFPDGETLLAYMQLPQPLVVPGDPGAPAVVETSLAASRAMAGQLHALHPLRHADEWEGMVLALDVRINYLAFKELELFYESSRFRAADAADLSVKIDALLEEAASLRDRFDRLYGSYLKTTEECIGTWSYIGKMERIRKTLSDHRSE